MMSTGTWLDFISNTCVYFHNVAEELTAPGLHSVIDFLMTAFTAFLEKLGYVALVWAFCMCFWLYWIQ